MASVPRLEISQVPLDLEDFKQFLIDQNYARSFEDLRTAGFDDKIKYLAVNHTPATRTLIEECVIVYYAIIDSIDLMRTFLDLQPPIFAILRSDSDINSIRHRRNIESRSTIHDWIENDRIDLFNLLFDSYHYDEFSSLFNMNFEQKVGQAGFTDIYDKLIEVGFVPSYIMLINSVIGRSIDLTIRLLNYGVPVNPPEDGFYGTEPRLTSPLFVCISTFQVNMLDYLVAYGANVNLPDLSGLTPLISIINGFAGRSPLYLQLKSQIIEKLLDYGANPDLTFLENKYPLIDGIKNNISLSLLEKMIARGANVNYQMANGETPLSVCRSVEQRNLLIKYGAE